MKRKNFYKFMDFFSMEWEEKKNIEFNLQLGSSIFMSYTSIPNFKLTNKNVIKFMT